MIKISKLIVLFFIISCSGNNDSIKDLALKDSMLIKQYLGQSSSIWIDEGYTVLTKSVNSKLKMKIISDTLINDNESENLIFTPFHLFMFDSSETETFDVKSRFGISYQKTNLTVATGDVFLNSSTDTKKINLKTDSLAYVQNSDEVFTKPVRVKVFTSNMDTLLYVITADSGWWNIETLKSQLGGSVVIDYLKNDVQLFCEDLLFDSKSDVIESRGHVKFKRVYGDYVEGDGFVSDSKFKLWKLKDNIKGEIFDVQMNGGIL